LLFCDGTPKAMPPFCLFETTDICVAVIAGRFHAMPPPLVLPEMRF
jgi:hypothetical protein